MDHQVENGGGKRELIKVSLDLLFGRVFDQRIIDHPRNLKRLVVRIFNRKFPR